MNLLEMLSGDPTMPPVRNPIPSSPGMAGPQAAPMPQITAPPQPRQSLLARIGSALAAAGGAVSDHIRPEAPAGYSGMLTPEEIESARPGLMQSLIGTPDAPSSDDRYRSRLDSMVERKQMGVGLQRQQELLATRKQIMSQFPPPKKGDFASFSSWVEQVYPALVQAGDYEGVKSLNAAMQQVLAAQGNPTKPVDDLEWQDMGGEKWLVQKSSGNVLRKEKKTPNVKDPNALDPQLQLREQRLFDRTQRLTDDFNKDTKPRRESAEKMLGAIQEAPRAMAGDGAAQMNVLYAFINGLDPESVVREGEVALARAATPLWEQARAMFDKYLKGESVVLPKGMVERITGLMQRRIDGHGRYVNERKGYYGSLAKRAGLDNTDDLFPMLNVPKMTAPPAGSITPTPSKPTGYSPNNPFAVKK